jgi:2-polyprenyl-6-methoxyphenol hydroxylase-like FAD-dependent oxidoreductase
VAVTELPQERVAVTIVGGGPIGLTMGLLLGRFGVPAVILERNATTTDHPKARGCFARTMELFRIWGIDKAIRERGLPDGADHWTVGRTVADLRATRPEIDPQQTPVWKSVVAQDAVEEELLRAVRGYAGTQLRFSTECSGFEQDADGVTAQCLDLRTGSRYSLRSQYLLACDGAGSRLRKLAGIPMTGIPSISYMVNDYLRVDLSDFPVACAAAGMILAPQATGDPWLSFLNSNGRDRWLALRRIGADRDERPRIPSDEEVIADAKRRLGVDRKIEVINRSTWRSAREVAARYRNERVFLVGDAAHRFLPTGGQGMNTGIADAHNLAWKLALVWRGALEPSVLDSYDSERRPVGNITADFQLSTGGRLLAMQQHIDLDDADSRDFWLNELEKHVKSVGITLGQWYPQGCLIPDATTPPALDPERYTPVDRPGHRFPHRWVDAAQTESTIDWFDTAFVLVTGPEAHAWRTAGTALAAELRAPLMVKTLAAPDREHGILIGASGAVLVRPDGYVAWRSPSRSPQPLEQLRQVMRALGVLLTPR